jgi:hypothetical protein
MTTYFTALRVHDTTGCNKGWRVLIRLHYGVLTIRDVLTIDKEGTNRGYNTF